jgi:hypothetical protein
MKIKRLLESSRICCVAQFIEGLERNTYRFVDLTYFLLSVRRCTQFTVSKMKYIQIVRTKPC